MGRPVPRGDSSGRMSRVKLPGVQLWSAYLVVGALALVLHANLETGSLQQSWFYDVVGASAVIAAIVGIVRNAPDRRLPWMLMAAGQALFVAGDVLWNWYAMIGEEPFPSLADVLYLAGYPFMAAGIFLLIRRRIGGGDRGGLLDAAILTTACAILSWTFIIQPQMGGSDLDPLSLGDHPGLPGDGPAADRLRDGPAHDARRSDHLVPAPRGVAAGPRRGRPRLRGPEPRRQLPRRRPGRLAVPRRLSDVRCLRPPSVHAPPHGPAPGRRHVARTGPDGRPRDRDGHRTAARHAGPGLGRRPDRRRRRHRPPVAPGPRPPCRTRGPAGARRRPAPQARGATQLPGLPRSTDRPRQSPPVRRAGRGRPSSRAPVPAPLRPCSSTSTTSRPSTTASAMPPATSSS